MSSDVKSLHAVVSGQVPSSDGMRADGVHTLMVVQFNKGSQLGSVMDHIKRESRTGVLELHFGAGSLNAMTWTEKRK